MAFFCFPSECCGLGNVFIGNIQHFVAMDLCLECGENDPLYSPPSPTHQAANNPRHKDTNMGYGNCDQAVILSDAPAVL